MLFSLASFSISKMRLSIGRHKLSPKSNDFKAVTGWLRMEIATHLPTVTSAVPQSQLETATSSAVNAELAVLGYLMSSSYIKKEKKNYGFCFSISKKLQKYFWQWNFTNSRNFVSKGIICWEYNMSKCFYLRFKHWPNNRGKWPTWLPWPPWPWHWTTILFKIVMSRQFRNLAMLICVVIIHHHGSARLNALAFSLPVFQTDGGSSSIPALQKWKSMDRNKDFKLDQEEIAYYLGRF